MGPEGSNRRGPSNKPLQRTIGRGRPLAAERQGVRRTDHMKARPQRFEALVLETNDAEKELSFGELDLMEDCLQMRVSVRSQGFSCSKTMMVDNFRYAVGALEEMVSALQGEVRLGAAYEDDELVFKMNHRGQLFVRGRLVANGEFTHKLEFEFQTDQTALAPFARELDGFLKVAG
jgi:hypothetical protein